MTMLRASTIAARVAVMVAMLGGQSVAWGGAYRGAPEQQAACVPGALRLCLDSIPDAGQAESCLRQQEADFNASCGSVFKRNGGASIGSAR